ncbi:heparinase II/III family protein [Yunchengibacter salinarum]|uniref:heparinase II/III family protein n=1 Tax=Yunchengibacter salinarum TaxID=3133399 RepID=UPI0035B5DB7F
MSAGIESITATLTDSRAGAARTAHVRDFGPGLAARLWAAGPRAFWRRLARWGYGRPGYDWRLKGRHPVQLLASPDDPVTGNATRGSALAGGDMMVLGRSLPVDDSFWDTLRHESDPVRREVESFNWLADLAAHGGDQARHTAERLTDQWIDRHERWSRTSWDPSLIAPRLINWIVHAPLVLSSSNLVYRSRVLLLAAKQARHLMRTAALPAPGMAQLETHAALVIAGVLLPWGERWYQRGLKGLRKVLDRFVLPDGCPISRNGADAIRAMRLLILVRDAHLARARRGDAPELPAIVQIMLDRLAPFVRAMRHPDGRFAQMNGLTARQPGADAILRAGESTGKPVENAPHGGYQRLSAGDALVIMDTGAPPPAPHGQHVHAATGAFEATLGGQRLITSLGHATPAQAEAAGMPDLAVLGRTTAAHSVLVLGDRNQTIVPETPDVPLGDGVRRVAVTRRRDDQAVQISLTHDGYRRRLGVDVIRELALSADGSAMEGEDRLQVMAARKLEKAGVDAAVIRFFLAPGITASLAPDGRVFLEPRRTAETDQDGPTAWVFTASGGTIALEDGLSLEDPWHPAPTQMITVTLPVTPTDPEAPIACFWRLRQSHW